MMFNQTSSMKLDHGYEFICGFVGFCWAMPKESHRVKEGDAHVHITFRMQVTHGDKTQGILTYYSWYITSLD